ncbi:MAG: YdiY family protein [Thermoanaerobaculales bacterium]
MKTRSFALLLTLMIGAVPVLAQETEEEAPEPIWTGSLGLAYLATSGNSDTTTFGLDFTTERKPTPWGLTIKGKFNRADENGIKTAERYLLGGRARRALGDRWELFAGLSAEKDIFAGYDLLFLVESGLTYRALTGPKHLLSFDGGLTWTDENRVPPEADVSYVGAILGLSYEWKISDNASLTQILGYYPNFDDSSDWRLNSETGLQTAVNSWFAVKLGYEVRFRNKPIGDNDDTDTTTTASVVFTF